MVPSARRPITVFNVGDTVGDYQIVSRIRSGGMATLYLGRRSGPAGFEREVALKVVHPHLAAEPRYIEMFLDEARLAAKIDHPNVVHIHEVGEAHSTLFLVMEYVQGASLWQVERALDRLDRAMPVELAVFIAIAVADGLHAAHETTGSDGQSLDVVHRDVSPQNVLIASRGHVKLIDFGIAKARGRIQQTVGANLKGKIRYMAPEQALGRPLDRRTDVYSLGIVLWEMLTHQRFHASADAMGLLEHVRAPKTIAPSCLNPAVTPALDAVVLAALAVDPEARIASAYEFRARLAQAAASALAIDASHLARFVSEALLADAALHPESSPSDAASEPPPDSPEGEEFSGAAISIEPAVTAGVFGNPGAVFDINTDQDSSPSPLVLPPVELSRPRPSALKTVVLRPSFFSRSRLVTGSLVLSLAVFAAGLGVTLGARRPMDLPVRSASPTEARAQLTESPVVVLPSSVEDPPPLVSQPLSPEGAAPRARPAASPLVAQATARAVLSRPLQARPQRPRTVQPTVPQRPGRSVQELRALPQIFQPVQTQPSAPPTLRGTSRVPIIEADPF